MKGECILPMIIKKTFCSNIIGYIAFVVGILNYNLIHKDLRWLKVML